MNRRPSGVRGAIVALGLAALLAVPAGAAHASAIVTWDLTGAPAVTDAPANAAQGLLGHSASYVSSGGQVLVAEGFFYLPGAPSTPLNGHLHRTTPTLANGLGVCSFTKISAASTTICDVALDLPLIDDMGAFEYIRLTTPAGTWRPVSLTLTVVHPHDQIRVYGANGPTVSFATPGNLAHGASSASTPFTLVLDPLTAGTPRHLFVSGNTFALGPPGFWGDDSFRLSAVTLMRVSEPTTGALLALAVLAGLGIRRRRGAAAAAR